MSTIVKIVPFDEVTTKTAHKISLHMEDVKIGFSSIFRVSLYDSDDVCFTHKYVVLEGQDYLNSQTDDKYVLKFITKTLGLKLME